MIIPLLFDIFNNLPFLSYHSIKASLLISFTEGFHHNCCLIKYFCPNMTHFCFILTIDAFSLGEKRFSKANIKKPQARLHGQYRKPLSTQQKLTQRSPLQQHPFQETVNRRRSLEQSACIYLICPTAPASTSRCPFETSYFQAVRETATPDLDPRKKSRPFQEFGQKWKGRRQ